MFEEAEAEVEFTIVAYSKIGLTLDFTAIINDGELGDLKIELEGHTLPIEICELTDFTYQMILDKALDAYNAQEDAKKIDLAREDN
jgi:hypothetical protein